MPVTQEQINIAIAKKMQGLPSQVDFKTADIASSFQDLSPQIKQAISNLNVPVTITSAGRSPSENASVGGVPNSRHLTNNAIDIRLDPNSSVIQSYMKDSGLKVVPESDHLHVEAIPGKKIGVTQEDLQAAIAKKLAPQGAGDVSLPSPALPPSVVQDVIDNDARYPIETMTDEQRANSRVLLNGGTPSKGEAAFRGAENMLSLGQAAKARALDLSLKGVPYDEALRMVENRDALLQEQFPKTYTTGQIAGSVKGPPQKLFNKIAGKVAPEGSGFFRRATGAGLGAAVVGQTQLPSTATPMERLQNAAISQIMGYPAEAVSTAIGSAVQLAKGGKVKGQYAKDVYPNAIEAQAQLQAKGFEVPLSPSDASRGAGKGAVQGLMEASPFSRGVARNFGDKQNQALNDVAQWLEQSQGIGVSEKVGKITGLKLTKPNTDLVDESLVANTVANKIDEAHKAFSAQADDLYGKVSQLATGVKFNPENTLKAINGVSKNLSAGGEAGGPVQSLISSFRRSFSPKNQQTLLDSAGMPLKPTYEMGFENLQAFRARINRLIENANGTGNKGDMRLLVQIKKGIDADVQGGAAKAMQESGNEAAAKALTEANSFYRTGKQKFQSEIFDQIMDFSKDQRSVKANKVLTDAIKNNEFEKIIALKRVVGEDGFQPIRQSFIQKMLRGGKEGYDIIGGNLKDQNNPLKKRLTALSEKTLKEMLDPESATVLQALGDIAPYAQSAVQASQNPRNIIRSAIGTTAVVGGGGLMAGGGGAATGASLAIANNLLGRAFYSDRVRNFLVSGYRPGMGEKELSRLATQVMGLTINAGVANESQ